MMADGPPTRTDLIERNMALALALFQEQVARPETLNDIPTDATIILLPTDDPELARFNRDLGLRALEAGEDVYFRHVRGRLAETA